MRWVGWLIGAIGWAGCTGQPEEEPGIGRRGPPPAADARPAPVSERPNVFLVIGCTVRRDQVAPYGGLPAATPFLARMADTGVVFTDAITAAPWTRVASTAIFTGRAFRAVGMAEPGPGANRQALAPELTTLAEVFGAAGYRTMGVVTNPNLNRIFGFDQGYDEYWEASPQFKEGGAKIHGFRAVDQLLTWLDRRTDDRPVFSSMMLLDAHKPGTVAPGKIAVMRADGAPGRVAQYRGLLEHFDRAVERLWDGLKQRGFDESNSVLIVVNDHGEGLQFPSRLDGNGHGRHVRPSTVGMVWLMHGVGIGQGRTVDGLASQIDVMPTLLGVAGLSSPEGVVGRDWSGLVRRGGRTDLAAAFVDTDMGMGDLNAIYTADRMCSIDRRTDPPLQQCFDRSTASALGPPADDDLERLAELRAWRAAIDAELAAFPHARRVTPSQAESQMLSALGYLQDDETETP